MGCCESKQSDEQLARKLQRDYDRQGGEYGSGQGRGVSSVGGRSSGGSAYGGRGQVLGGGGTATGSPAATPEERRAAAAAAAEARAQDWKQGGNADKEKARKMGERRTKDELVGKIEAHYAAKGEDPPFGLPAASVEVLRKHLADAKGR